MTRKLLIVALAALFTGLLGTGLGGCAASENTPFIEFVDTPTTQPAGTTPAYLTRDGDDHASWYGCLKR